MDPMLGPRKQEDGTYTIMCPSAKNAGVLDTAKADINAMAARMKARRKGRKEKKKGTKRTATAASYATLTDEDKKRVKEEYEASTRTPPGQIFVIDVQRDNVQVLTHGTRL